MTTSWQYNGRYDATGASLTGDLLETRNVAFNLSIGQSNNAYKELTGWKYNGEYEDAGVSFSRHVAEAHLVDPFFHDNNLQLVL